MLVIILNILNNLQLQQNDNLGKVNEVQSFMQRHLGTICSWINGLVWVQSVVARNITFDSRFLPYLVNVDPSFSAGQIIVQLNKPLSISVNLSKILQTFLAGPFTV